MSPAVLGILWAAMFAVPVSVLSLLPVRIKPRRRPASRPAPRPGARTGRGKPAQEARPRARPRGVLSWRGAAVLLTINLVLLYGIDSLAFYRGRPMMTFAGLVPLI